MPITPYQETELYEFTRGTYTWYYTSSSSPITLGDFTYAPTVIDRSAISSSPEEAKNSLTITMDRLSPVAQLWAYTAPTTTVTVSVKAYNAGGLGLTDLIWSGRVLGVNWKEGDEVELSCEPITVSRGRNAVFRRYGKRCPYALYDGDTCRVQKIDHAHETTVSAISGSSLTVASTLSKPYAGGFVEWDTGTHIETRFIESYSGNQLSLMNPFVGLAVSDTVTIYPGCDRTLSTCDTVYSNSLRYGGWPYMRRKNPFKTGVGYSSVDTYDGSYITIQNGSLIVVNPEEGP